MNEKILVVDKDAGPTSFDVVRKVKRVFPNTKIGHTGSLDPFATGVLVLMMGRATRLADSLLNADKKYWGAIELGTATDTMDRTGQVIDHKPVPALTQELVETVLKSFEGTWMQTPPMYSAKKIQGVRFYELARQNIQVERKASPVELYSVELKKLDLPTIEFEVHCSKGTYIRVLADEIAKKLGTVGHLRDLRRLSCGPFNINEGATIGEVEAAPERFSEQARVNYLNFVRGGYARNPLPMQRANDKRIVH